MVERPVPTESRRIRTPVLGFDIVDLAHFRQIAQSNASFQNDVFTHKEIGISQKHASPFVILALCFAAKEAVFKALGWGLWGFGGLRIFQEIEISPDASPPRLNISGGIQKAALRRNLTESHLSLAQTKYTAAALVVLSAADKSNTRKKEP